MIANTFVVLGKPAQIERRRRAAAPMAARPRPISIHSEGSGTAAVANVMLSSANWPRSVVNALQLPLLPLQK